MKPRPQNDEIEPEWAAALDRAIVKLSPRRLAENGDGAQTTEALTDDDVTEAELALVATIDCNLGGRPRSRQGRHRIPPHSMRADVERWADDVEHEWRKGLVYWGRMLRQMRAARDRDLELARHRDEHQQLCGNATSSHGPMYIKTRCGLVEVDPLPKPSPAVERARTENRLPAPGKRSGGELESVDRRWARVASEHLSNYELAVAKFAADDQKPAPSSAARLAALKAVSKLVGEARD